MRHPAAQQVTIGEPLPAHPRWEARHRYTSALMVMVAERVPAELIRITDITQELSVGVGLAVASVRTLSNVSLTVNAGELIVLSGSRGAGERALLAVIAGDRRGVSGSCTIATHTRIRLLRISPAAALALAEEWQRAESMFNARSADSLNREISRELFLLDVVHPRQSTQRELGTPSSPRDWNESNRSALLSWAAQCRAQGGAVVMAAGPTLGNSLISSAFGRLRQTWGDTHGNSPRSVRETTVVQSSVRVIAMHSGRLAPSVQLTLHSSEHLQP